MNSAPQINPEEIKNPSEIATEQLNANAELNETLTFLNAVLKKLSPDDFSELFDSLKEDPKKLARFMEYSRKYKDMQEAAGTLKGVNQNDVKMVTISLESIGAKLEESEK